MSTKGRIWAATTQKVKSRWTDPDVDPCGKRKKGCPRQGGYGICSVDDRRGHYIRRCKERDIAQKMIIGDLDFDALWPLE